MVDASYRMRRVGRIGTAPELRIRRLLRRLGAKFRVNVAALPGTPDIVISEARVVVLVHGCFWHRHRCHAGQSMPAHRAEYWSEKFAGNKRRDQRVRQRLRRLGWRVVVVWECEVRRGDDFVTELLLRKALR